MKIKKWSVLNSVLLIILLAALLRLWKLGSIPPHLTPDEAALGYNAYTIFKTGRDEYGKLTPLIFQSFGDYKPGFYVYATIPFIAVFGLSEWVVRLPSALAGIISVYLIYLVVKMFRRDKKQNSGLKIEYITALAAATNPWLINFSRAAWEVNLALMLTLVGIYFFLKSLKNANYLLPTALAFASTFLTYQGAKLSTIIILIILTIVFWDNCKKLLKNSRKILVVSTIAGLILVSPVVQSFTRGQTGRLQVFSLFSYRRPMEVVQEILNQGGETEKSFGFYLFHSEGLYHFKTFLNHYFNHFSGRFLFFEGDWQNSRHTTPNSGIMLLLDLVFLPIGTFALIKSRNKKLRNLTFLWLIFAPLPSVLSRDQVHAVRALNTAIPLVILSAFGLNFLIRTTGKLKFKNFLYSFLSVFYFLSFAYFLDSCFVHVKIHQANDWFYGYRETVREVDELRTSHDNVLFVQSYAQPYIYFLFYRAVDNPDFDPGAYQKSLEEDFAGDTVDVGLVSKLDNIIFAGYSWPAPAVTGDIVVGTPVDIPDFFANDRFKMIDEIKQPNGNPAFRIVEKL